MQPWLLKVVQVMDANRIKETDLNNYGGGIRQTIKYSCVFSLLSYLLFLFGSIKDVDKQLSKCCVQVKSPEGHALLFTRGLGDEETGQGQKERRKERLRHLCLEEEPPLALHLYPQPCLWLPNGTLSKDSPKLRKEEYYIF